MVFKRAAVSPNLANQTADYASIGLLVPLALIWGYNWVVAKTGTDLSEPFTFGALSALFGGISLLLLLVMLRRPVLPKAPVLILSLGVLQTSGFLGLAMWALKTGAAGKTSVLVYTMPFWLILMAWVFLGERLGRLQWTAVIVALGGLVFILSPWQSRGSLVSSILAIGAGFSWAAGVIVAKLIHRRHQIDTLSLTAWQMFFGSIPLILAAVFSFDMTSMWSIKFGGALAYNVLLGSALGYVIWMYLVRSLPAGTAGIGSLAVPVVGLASAWIQLGERPSFEEAVGIGLVLAALTLLTLREVIAGERVRMPNRANPET